MAVRGERENRLMNRGTRLLEPMDLPRGGYRTVGGTVPCQLLVNSTEVYVPYHESLLLPRCHCRGADERRLNAAFHRCQEHRARKRSRLTKALALCRVGVTADCPHSRRQSTPPAFRSSTCRASRHRPGRAMR